MGCCGKQTPPKKLTVGIPVYSDYRAATMTIQSVRLHGGVSDGNLDVLVVDNHPDGSEGQSLKEFCRSAGVRYATCPTVGTAPPRDTIFSHAAGEIVCVIDSHVLLEPGALSRLVAFADANPKSLDLWHGPLVYDPLKPNEGIPAMKPEWGDDLMFGRWAEPWTFSSAADDPPIEIPMHGMGLVACRKSAWVRSPAGLRGFGGCEGMIHERWRQLGRKVLCLPFLRWWHLFHDQKVPTAYPNTYEDRCRNYLVWALHLTLPVDDIVARFSGLLGEQKVNRLLTEAKNATAAKQAVPSLPRKVWNYAQAVAAHIAAGSPEVTEAEYRERLDACNTCEKRVENDCGICGCPIDEKARWREQQCPFTINGKPAPKWPLLIVPSSSPTAAPLSKPVKKPQVDPAVCEHRQFSSHVRIDRSTEPPYTTLLTTKCNACGTICRFEGFEAEAVLKLIPPVSGTRSDNTHGNETQGAVGALSH